MCIFAYCISCSFPSGPVMSTFNLIGVWYGYYNGATFDPWIENFQADAWLTNMAGSQQYFGWLSEYNTESQSIQPGTYGGQYGTTSDISQSTLSDEQIASALSTAIDQNEVPQPDDSTEYILYIPKGISVSDPTGALFCQVFCAYHSHFDYNGLQVKYAVVPYSSDCQGCAQSYEIFASTISHEIAETITDPLAGSWYDQCGEEIGDICAYQTSWAQGTDGYYYPVQLLWSNSQGQCFAGYSTTKLSQTKKRALNTTGKEAKKRPLDSTEESVEAPTKKTSLRAKL